MMTTNTQGRAHWYGPNGEQRIFEAGEEVPSGWRDHPFDDKPSSFDRDGDGKPGGSLPASPPALTGKNKAELLAIAEEEGAEIEEGATNPEIVEAIEAKRNEAG